MKLTKLKNLETLASLKASHAKTKLSWVHSEITRLKAEIESIFCEKPDEAQDVSAAQLALQNSYQVKRVEELRARIRSLESEMSPLKAIARRAIGREAVLTSLGKSTVQKALQKSRRQMS